MANSSAWHPNRQSANMASLPAISISEFRSFIDQLVKCGIHVICKLYFCHGFHSFGCSANRKSSDSLLTQGCIEDSFSSVVFCEIHTATEDTAERNVFTKDQNRLIRSQGKRESIIDGLEEVHPLGSIIADLRREFRILQRSLRGMGKKRGRREVGGDIEAGIRGMRRVWTESLLSSDNSGALREG